MIRKLLHYKNKSKILEYFIRVFLISRGNRMKKMSGRKQLVARLGVLLIASIVLTAFLTRKLVASVKKSGYPLFRKGKARIFMSTRMRNGRRRSLKG